MNEAKEIRKDQKLEKRMEKEEHHAARMNLIFRQTLHWMERIIAVITLLALAGNLILECWGILAEPTKLQDLSHILHSLLGIVVGLEFVRMLIDTTPANIIEVLVVAITRHVVLTHEEPFSNLLSILCIAGLFAVRRFLIRPDELREEMVEED